MFLLGLLLILIGIIAVLAALFSTSGTASFLGADLDARTIFLIGVAAGAAILWGYTISKFGARRSLRARRDRRELQRLSNRRDREQADREPPAAPPSNTP